MPASARGLRPLSSRQLPVAVPSRRPLPITPLPCKPLQTQPQSPNPRPQTTPSPFCPPNPFTTIFDHFLLITKAKPPNRTSKSHPSFYPGIGYFPMSSVQEQLSQPPHRSPRPPSPCVTRFSQSTATRYIQTPYLCTRNPAILRGVRHHPSGNERLPVTLGLSPGNLPSPRRPARATACNPPSSVESPTYKLSDELAASPWPERATAEPPGNAILKWTDRLSLRVKPCSFGILLNTRKPACG